MYSIISESLLVFYSSFVRHSAQMMLLGVYIRYDVTASRSRNQSFLIQFSLFQPTESHLCEIETTSKRQKENYWICDKFQDPFPTGQLLDSNRYLANSQIQFVSFVWDLPYKIHLYSFAKLSNKQCSVMIDLICNATNVQYLYIISNTFCFDFFTHTVVRKDERCGRAQSADI